MRYIAKKNKDKYIVTGIKEMETINGEKVEVKVDSKEYDKTKLEEVLIQLENEKEMAMERYIADIKDINAILEAIKNSK